MREISNDPPMSVRSGRIGAIKLMITVPNVCLDKRKLNSLATTYVP